MLESISINHASAISGNREHQARNQFLPPDYPKFITQKTEAPCPEYSKYLALRAPALQEPETLNLLNPESLYTYSLHCSSFSWLTKISIIGS